MSVFQDIIKGMADGAETLQANFAKLAKAISAIDDDGTIHFGSVSAENLAVTGTPKSEPIKSSIFQEGGYVIQSGSTVQVLFRVTPNQSFSSAGDTTIGTLPDGFSLPAANPATGFVIDVTSGSNIGSLRVYTNGTITINMNSNADLNGHFLEMQVMYIA